MAERRIYWDSTFNDWPDYDVLIAAPDCHLLGRDGWFISGDIKTVLVVDCAQAEHKGSMVGWFDANVRERDEGWLVLK